MEPRAYGPYPYEPIDDRAPLAWPGGARVAFWVVPNIEVFALNERMPEGPGLIPDVAAWGRRDYGNRVGVFRVIEVMARHGVRGTAALNAEVCDAHPRIVEECLEAGWEMMGHCQSNTRRLNEAGSEEAAGRIIAATLARIERATGARPRGWLGAGRQETWGTLERLAAEGCTYVADWDSDDQPLLMDVGGAGLVSLPYGAGVSDKQAIEGMHFTADEFETMARRAFDVLYEEGARAGRVATVSLHPYIIGVPHRIGALDRILAHVRGHDGVWLATGGEIARHFLDQRGRRGGP